MKVGDLGDAFRVVMSHSGWSGNHLAKELGTSQPWISMVLNGKRDPGMHRSAELLERAGWELHMVPREEDPVRRRQFLMATAGATFIPAPTASPYTSAAYLDGITGRLTHNEAQLGGAPLSREAARHVARAVPAAEAAGQSVQAAASRLLRQCALVLHDVRQLSRAEETAAMALKLARSADDLPAQMQALDTLSLITAHLPDGRGAAYARYGLRLPEASDSDRAMLAARLGRALALAPGRKGEARRWLEDALELQQTGEAEVSGNCGIGFTDAGLTGLGERYLATAASLTASSPFLHSLYVARQAKTAIRGREPEVTARRMLELAALAPLVDSPRLTIHLRHVYDGTRRWDGIREVREARGALKEAMA
jgi:transcriptional regulator with XRE-family HTH domain